MLLRSSKGHENTDISLRVCIREDEEFALYEEGLQEFVLILFLFLFSSLFAPSQKYDRTVKQTLPLRDELRDDTYKKGMSPSVEGWA